MKIFAHLAGNTRVGSLAAAAALVVAAAFCKGREVPEGQCSFNSDCDNNYVCAGRYCRRPCQCPAGVAQSVCDSDCRSAGAGYTCRRADDGVAFACYAPTDPYRCIYHSECNTERRQICARDGFCRSQCARDYDCEVLTGSRSSMCVAEADAGDAGGTCSFRLDDAGADDVHVEDDAPADDAAGGDAGSDAGDASGG
ncbi:MAG: hypothetical protein U0324_28015 [Polyangiales bacterium]